MGDEHHGDAPERSRADVYSSARIGAAAALTLVLVVLLVLDVAVPDYDSSPGILLPLPDAILALLGLEARPSGGARGEHGHSAAPLPA